MSKPRLLDLFAGGGGAAMGYHRAGFEVYGIDNEVQRNYPFKILFADAIEILDRLVAGKGVFGHTEWDAIHASPPCQAYSNLAKRDRHPALIEEVRARLDLTGLPYVIENVVGAPLEQPIMLCGSSFGLGVERHRLFECNFPVLALPCAHGMQPKQYEVYQHGRTYMSRVAHVWGSGGGKAREHWGEAMGIDWMTDRELAEAIPPAMTEHIGGFLMQAVDHERAAA